LKNEFHNISDEMMDDFFISEGMTKNLAKTLMRLSKIDDEDDTDYNYSVFIYDTCRYPPNSNPHRTLN